MSAETQHCEWCGYDGAPHGECEAKIVRRNTINEALLPALQELGLNPWKGNLIYKLAAQIESQIEKDQQS